MSVAFVFDFHVPSHAKRGVWIALEVILAGGEVDGNVDSLTWQLQ
jgi:hypothetical protein